MFDQLAYFRAEIDTVGRQWVDAVSALDHALALRRPVRAMNHALWLTGHMAWAEDCMLLEIPTGKSVRRKEWDVLFDHSSEKLADEAYPPWGEVRAEYGRVHAETMRHLYQLTSADLARPSALERQWLPTPAHSIAHQATHGHYHLGQLIYLRKLLLPGSAEEGAV